MTQKPIIGMLHCGDLGSSLARILKENGSDVVTSVAGRSEETHQRAKLSGARLVSGVSEVVRESDIVISLVNPNSALSVAQEFIDAMRATGKHCTFVDGNSIGVEEANSIASAFGSGECRWIDLAIHGGADRLADSGVAYLSGQDTTEIENVLKPVMRTVHVSDRVGDASILKQAIASFSKTLNAVFLESAILAKQCGVSELFQQEFRNFYPGIVQPVERMLPTFCQHVERRIAELQNIEKLAESANVSSQLVTGAKNLFGTLKKVLQETEFLAAESQSEKINKILSNIVSEK